MTRRKPRNALYLLPNAFTTAALFAGFYAILQAISGEWQQAALAVLAAALLDACDGRVARWTNTQSVFGVEYDSLSDAVSFGVAPSIIFYQWSLHGMGRVGLAIAFCFCAATALRLARFNSQSGSADHRYFIGIPSPAAALLAISYVATNDSFDVNLSPVFDAALLLLLAFSMVSGVRFYSFKGINLKTRAPFRSGVLLLVFGAAFVNILTYDIMLAVLAMLSLYLLSGYAAAVWGLITRKRASAARKKSEEAGTEEVCNNDQDKG